MLVVEGLTCRFGTKVAVDGASFEIAPGGFVGVIGRSGAGKSTLLRTINRLATPTEGRILFDGIDVTALRGKELRQWRARAAMIFQQFNLVSRLDVLTNVLMGRLSEVPTWRSLVQLWPEPDIEVAMSASLIGRLRSSTFRLSATAMSMSLTGSRFSSESAPGPFHHGIRGRGGTIFRAALRCRWQVQAT